MHNGVRQGDLFCVYIDNLLQRRSRSGVGCYLGENFAGSLAHAEILCIRDDDCRVPFSGGRSLSTSEVNCILSYVSSSRS